jgi:hypothetical protein
MGDSKEKSRVRGGSIAAVAVEGGRRKELNCPEGRDYSFNIQKKHDRKHCVNPYNSC